MHSFSFITKNFLIFILFSYFIPITIVSFNFSVFVIRLCLFFLFLWFLILWHFVWRIILCMIKIPLNWLKLILPWHMVPLDSVFCVHRGQNVCSAVSGQSISHFSIMCNWCVVLLEHSISMLILCAVVLSIIESRLLKNSTIMFQLLILPWILYCFTYLGICC